MISNIAVIKSPISIVTKAGLIKELTKSAYKDNPLAESDFNLWELDSVSSLVIQYNKGIEFNCIVFYDDYLTELDYIFELKMISSIPFQEGTKFLIVEGESEDKEFIYYLAILRWLSLEYRELGVLALQTMLGYKYYVNYSNGKISKIDSNQKVRKATSYNDLILKRTYEIFIS